VNIFVELRSEIPAHVQIGYQVRFACMHKTLRPGDELPSIRRLARKVGVGGGVVRRAYRELRQTGILATEGRRHVVCPSAGPPPPASDIVGATAALCDQLLQWAADHSVSAVALSRLLLRHALEREVDSPSCLLVDICTQAAEHSAAKVARAWRLKVAGMSLSDFAHSWHDHARNVSAVLVSEGLYPNVMKAAAEIKPRIFPFKTRLDERLRRRIGGLPARSRVVIVCPGEIFSEACRAVSDSCRRLFPGRTFRTMNADRIPDLAKFVRAQRAGLVLFSPLVWMTLPAAVRRKATVAPAFTEPDPQSLESIRISAGVVL